MPLSRSARVVIGLALAGLAVVAPGAAHACRFPYYYENRASFPRTDFAAVMVEKAAFVDVAVLRGAEPIDIDGWIASALANDLSDITGVVGRKAMRDLYADTARDLRREGAARLVFRSIEHLKRQGPDEFSLYGFRTRTGSGWDERPATLIDRLSPKAVWSSGETFELSPTRVVALCSRWVRARADQPYLIFRDADGRLLGPGIRVVDPVEGTEELRQGFVFAPVELSGDAWLEAVRAAAGR